jgi:hypothetical protein
MKLLPVDRQKFKRKVGAKRLFKFLNNKAGGETLT